MRRAQLIEFVEQLVEERWAGPDQDIAQALVEDDAFGVLANALNNAGDGDQVDIANAFERTASELSDAQLDWLVGDTADGSQADSPAAFLASKVDEVA